MVNCHARALYATVAVEEHGDGTVATSPRLAARMMEFSDPSPAGKYGNVEILSRTVGLRHSAYLESLVCIRSAHMQLMMVGLDFE